MKTTALKLMTLLTLITFVLYNCKEKDAQTLQPLSTELSDQIDKLELNTITLDVTKDLKVTPGNIELSAKATEVNVALQSITSPSAIPSIVSAAATEVSKSLSAQEISTISKLTTAQAASNSTVKSADIQKILAKAAVDSKLQAYLPKLSLTSIEGLAEPGKKGSSGNSYNAKNVESGEQDACVDLANEKYNEAKGRIEDKKAKELEKISDAYNKDLEKIEKDYAKCIGDNSPQNFEKLRQTGISIADKALDALEKAKPYLKNGQYEFMKVLINIQLLDYLDKVNKLELEKTGSCARLAELAKERAASVRDSNIAKVEAAFQEAIQKAEEILAKMIAACHNQGSSN